RLDPEVWDRLGSHPELVTSRFGKELCFFLRDNCRVALLQVDLGRQRIDCRQCSSQIVAVKALADAQTIFGILPRAKDQIALWAGDGLDDSPGIGRERAYVGTVIEVLAHPGDGAKFVQPLDLIFDEDAAACL